MVPYLFKPKIAHVTLVLDRFVHVLPVMGLRIMIVTNNII